MYHEHNATHSITSHHKNHGKATYSLVSKKSLIDTKGYEPSEERIDEYKTYHDS